MQFLFNILSSLLSSLVSLGVSFWGVLRTTIERYWWLLVVAIIGGVWPLFAFAQDMFYWLQNMLGTWMFDHIGSYTVTSEILQGLSLANYILPVAEVIAMTIGYATVLGIMTIYRFVKSYIPNVVSGGT